MEVSNKFGSCGTCGLGFVVWVLWFGFCGLGFVVWVLWFGFCGLGFGILMAKTPHATQTTNHKPQITV
jgi:hypothetical protein